MSSALSAETVEELTQDKPNTAPVDEIVTIQESGFQVVQGWGIAESVFYMVVPLVILLLINTAIQNKITDHESRNGLKMGLGAIIGIWFVITVAVIAIKIFALV